MNSFFINLDHLDLALVTGEDNSKFLQGQLTCDMDELSTEIDKSQSCLGAACDNKGRVFANFIIFKIESEFYLQMQAGLAATFKAQLDKYIPFYKAKILKANDKFQCFGFAGDCQDILSKLFPTLPSQEGDIVSHNGRHLILLNQLQSRFVLLAPPDSIDPATHFSNLAEGKKQDWTRLDIESGHYFINPADVGQYTPEILNLDTAGAVSFTKGCYTGQEIVARMHYRGKAKKRLYRLAFQSTDSINVGTAETKAMIVVDKQSQKKLGSLLQIVQIEENHFEALGILVTAAETLQPTLKLNDFPAIELKLIPFK